MIERHDAVDTICQRRHRIQFEHEFGCDWTVRLAGSRQKMNSLTSSRMQGGAQPFGHYNGMLHGGSIYAKLYESIVQSIFLMILLDMPSRRMREEARTRASKLSKTSPSHGVRVWPLAPFSASMASPKRRRSLLFLRSLYLATALIAT